MIVLYILIALAILMLMILIHELGHYVVGRWLGFKITEFSIGFGKAIFQKINKRGEKISLRILPLGGYCAFYGEEGAEEDDKNSKNEKTQDDDSLKTIPRKDDPDIFTNQPPWKRILVFFAGVTFNFLSALIFAFILLVSFGYGNCYKVDYLNEHFYDAAITYNIDNPNNPNQIIYFEKGDKITKINGTKIDYVWSKTTDTLIENTVGNRYVFTVIKGSTGETVEYSIVIQNNISQILDTDESSPTYGQYIDEYDENGQIVYYTGIGLSMALSSTPVSFLEALGGCFSLCIGFAWLVLKTFWLLITFQLPLTSLGGTLTVISTVATSMSVDLSVVLTYLPLIAVNLAVFNILPLPALDGGHVVFTTIEAIRGKPIKQSVESTIHFIGLIVLFAFVILLDLLHFIT